MRRLLVTGGAGFIGSNFLHQWMAGNPDDAVIVLDALTYAGDRRNLAGLRLRFVHGNIADRPLVEALLREDGIDTIVNFASESHVDRSIAGPDPFIATNVLGTHSLLAAARQVWIGEGRAPTHRFHHVSTDEVFGSLSPAAPPADEHAAYAPNSPYAASKAAADHLVRAYHHTYGLDVTISNSMNNYGPRQHPEKLIPLCLINLLLGRSLPIYGDGQNVRGWMHVDDHCRGIGRVLSAGRAGQAYNLGVDSGIPNLELVHLLCRLVDARFAAEPQLSRRFPSACAASRGDSRTSITFVADRPGHDRRYALNSDKARRELGYNDARPLESGLAATLDWYLANEESWRSRVGR
jgi:dTDP-glucose 4,6-dehydratase